MIPPNSTAEVHVPTTNAAAILEGGVPAASSSGVIYVGYSNNAAIYSVGSGEYRFSSPFHVSVMAPPTLIITATNQTGSGSGKFYPDWTVRTNGSLIAGLLPSTVAGNFSLEAAGRNVSALTTSNDLGIELINVGDVQTSSTNYVTCGNGGGAGSTLVYGLTNNPFGYDLTNITVYGGWANSGRDQQSYSVYYSTIAAPADFVLLGSVNFNPSIGGGVQSATRMSLTSSSGVLAANVAALKLDFTTPGSENGYCGYAAVAAFGRDSLAPVAPFTSSLEVVSPVTLVLTLSNLVAGRSYVVQSTTNLTADDWMTDTSVIPTQATFVLSNLANTAPQKFFRVFGF